MARRHGCYSARCPHNLKAFALLHILIRREISKILFKKPAHQSEARCIVLNIFKLILKRGHAQWHRNPIDNLAHRLIPDLMAKASVHAHNRLGALLFGHVRQINPDQLGRTATNINDKQLLGLRAHKRCTRNHREPCFFFRRNDI